MAADFTDFEPSARDYWRGIILFGRNVASFKFALADALLEVARTGVEVVPLDELARAATLRQSDLRASEAG